MVRKTLGFCRSDEFYVLVCFAEAPPGGFWKTPTPPVSDRLLRPLLGGLKLSTGDGVKAVPTCLRNRYFQSTIQLDSSLGQKAV